ncbi:hypothetical protein ACFLSJ_00675 [Verrucomicrobiota bacterium]
MSIPKKTRVVVSCIAGVVALLFAGVVLCLSMRPSPDSFNPFRDHPVSTAALFWIPLIVIVLANARRKKDESAP